MELKDVILSTLAEMEDEQIIENHIPMNIEKKEMPLSKPLQKTIEENYEDEQNE